MPLKKALVVLPLLALLTLPLSADTSKTATASSPWTSGSLSLETRQVDKATFEIVLDIEVDDIAAAVVHVPGEERDLVRITAQDAKDFLNEALSPRASMASLSLGMPTLQGALSQRLQYDGTKLQSIEVILVLLDGTVVPSTFTANSFGKGGKYTLNFGRRGCYTVSGTCHCDANGDNCGCSDSTTCCTFPPQPCFDCAGGRCEITCGPCSQPPPT